MSEPIFLSGENPSNDVVRRSRELLNGRRPPENYIVGARPFSGIDLRDPNRYFGPGLFDVREAGMDRRLGEAQPWYDQAWRATKRSLIGIPLTLFETMGHISDLTNYAAALGQTHSDFSNGFTIAAQAGRDWIEDGNAIYQSNPGDLIDLGDSGWWFTHAPGLIESLAAFYVTGAGIGAIASRGAAALGNAIRGVAQGERASAAVASAQRGLNAGAQLLTAAELAYTEGAMEAARNYEQIFAERLPVVGTEQAKLEASQAAATTVRFNMVNTALNLTGVAAIFRGFDNARTISRLGLNRLAGEAPEAYMARLAASPDKFTRSLTSRVLPYVGESGQESLEEIVNEAAARMGQERAKPDGRRGISDFATVLGEAAGSDEGQLAALLGFIGGSGQRVLMRHVPTPEPLTGIMGTDATEGRRWSNESAREARQLERTYTSSRSHILQRAQKISALQKAGRAAVESGDRAEYDRIQAELSSEVSLDGIVNGTEDQIAGMFNEIADLSDAEATERGFLVEGDGGDFREKAKKAAERLKAYSKTYQNYRSYFADEEPRGFAERALRAKIMIDEQRDNLSRAQASQAKAQEEYVNLLSSRTDALSTPEGITYALAKDKLDQQRNEWRRVKNVDLSNPETLETWRERLGIPRGARNVVKGRVQKMLDKRAEDINVAGKAAAEEYTAAKEAVTKSGVDIDTFEKTLDGLQEAQGERDVEITSIQTDIDERSDELSKFFTTEGRKELMDKEDEEIEEVRVALVDAAKKAIKDAETPEEIDEAVTTAPTEVATDPTVVEDATKKKQELSAAEVLANAASAKFEEGTFSISTTDDEGGGEPEAVAPTEEVQPEEPSAPITDESQEGSLPPASPPPSPPVLTGPPDPIPDSPSPDDQRVPTENYAPATLTVAQAKAEVSRPPEEPAGFIKAREIAYRSKEGKAGTPSAKDNLALIDAGEMQPGSAITFQVEESKEEAGNIPIRILNENGDLLGYVHTVKWAQGKYRGAELAKQVRALMEVRNAVLSGKTTGRVVSTSKGHISRNNDGAMNPLSQQMRDELEVIVFVSGIPVAHDVYINPKSAEKLRKRDGHYKLLAVPTAQRNPDGSPVRVAVAVKVEPIGQEFATHLLNLLEAVSKKDPRMMKWIQTNWGQASHQRIRDLLYRFVYLEHFDRRELEATNIRDTQNLASLDHVFFNYNVEEGGFSLGMRKGAYYSTLSSQFSAKDPLDLRNRADVIDMLSRMLPNADKGMLVSNRPLSFPIIARDGTIETLNWPTYQDFLKDFIRTNVVRREVGPNKTPTYVEQVVVEYEVTDEQPATIAPAEPAAVLTPPPADVITGEEETDDPFAGYDDPFSDPDIYDVDEFEGAAEREEAIPTPSLPNGAAVQKLDIAHDHAVRKRPLDTVRDSEWASYMRAVRLVAGSAATVEPARPEERGDFIEQIGMTRGEYDDRIRNARQLLDRAQELWDAGKRPDALAAAEEALAVFHPEGYIAPGEPGREDFVTGRVEESRSATVTPTDPSVARAKAVNAVMKDLSQEENARLESAAGQAGMSTKMLLNKAVAAEQGQTVTGMNSNVKRAIERIGDIIAKVLRLMVAIGMIFSGVQGASATPIVPSTVIEKVATEEIKYSEDSNIETIQRFHSTDSTTTNYAIVNKAEGSLDVYNSSGEILYSTPVGVGQIAGDEESTLVGIRGADMNNFQTPGGSFTIGARGDSAQWSAFGGRIIRFSNDATGETSLSAIHQVPIALEGERLPALKDDDPENNRMSMGCINVTAKNFEFIEGLLAPGAKMYVLPDNPDSHFAVRDGALVFESESEAPIESPTVTPEELDQRPTGPLVDALSTPIAATEREIRPLAPRVNSELSYEGVFDFSTIEDSTEVEPVGLGDTSKIAERLAEQGVLRYGCRI